MYSRVYIYIIIIINRISLSGSGIYQVIFSSVTIWSALIGRIFLHRYLNTKQWLAIIFVTFGLYISTRGDSNKALTSNTLLGMLSSLFGTILFAGSYILGDYLQTNANVSPRDICIRVGSYYTLAIMIYILLYTVPNFKLLVYDKVIQSNGKLSMILFVYILTVISQTIHGFAFFSCLGNVGAVSTGTVSGLRAIIVFFLSSYLFCSYTIYFSII